MSALRDLDRRENPEAWGVVDKLKDDCQTLIKERDEALRRLGVEYERNNKLTSENERLKQETNALAKKYLLAANERANERDEARAEVERLQGVVRDANRRWSRREELLGEVPKPDAAASLRADNERLREEVERLHTLVDEAQDAEAALVECVEESLPLYVYDNGDEGEPSIHERVAYAGGELRRLEAKNELLRATSPEYEDMRAQLAGAWQMLAKAKAENVRLREALERVRSIACTWHRKWWAVAIQKIVSAALPAPSSAPTAKEKP